MKEFSKKIALSFLFVFLYYPLFAIDIYKIENALKHSEAIYIAQKQGDHWIVSQVIYIDDKSDLLLEEGDQISVITRKKIIDNMKYNKFLVFDLNLPSFKGRKAQSEYPILMEDQRVFGLDAPLDMVLSEIDKWFNKNGNQ